MVTVITMIVSLIRLKHTVNSVRWVAVCRHSNWPKTLSEVDSKRRVANDCQSHSFITSNAQTQHEGLQLGPTQVSSKTQMHKLNMRGCSWALRNYQAKRPTKEQ